ncbi:hypothetical protein CRM22_000064, partial [Opisthorchis felineus]
MTLNRKLVYICLSFSGIFVAKIISKKFQTIMEITHAAEHLKIGRWSTMEGDADSSGCIEGRYSLQLVNA